MSRTALQELSYDKFQNASNADTLSHLWKLRPYICSCLLFIYILGVPLEPWAETNRIRVDNKKKKHQIAGKCPINEPALWQQMEMELLSAGTLSLSLLMPTTKNVSIEYHRNMKA